jgi:hypothetical protein
MSLTRWLVWLACIFGLTWFGFWAAAEIARPFAIDVFEPQLLRCFAGETIRVKTIATNYSLLPSRVLNLEPSCGCASVETKGLTYVGAKSRVPLTFVVDSTGKLGRIDFGGRFESVDAFGRVYERAFSIPITVLQPWYSTAHGYYWPAENDSLSVQGTFFLFDHAGLDPIPLPQPSIDGDGQMRIDVATDFTETDLAEFKQTLEESEVPTDLDCRLRACVHFNWRVDPVGTSASSRVVFRPEQSQASGITIRFLTAQQLPPIRVRPEIATVLINPGESRVVQRFQVCSSEVPIESLRCQACPAGVQVDSVKRMDPSQWSITCSIANDAPRGRLLLDLRANETISVPVTLDVLSASAATGNDGVH